jgi:hypothetical protein
VDGLEDDLLFLGWFGMHALSPSIYEVLAQMIRDNVRDHGEFHTYTSPGNPTPTRRLSGFGNHVRTATVRLRYTRRLRSEALDNSAADAVSSPRDEDEENQREQHDPQHDP